MENHSTSLLELLCAKTRSKKNQIVEKWGNFENRLSCTGYSLCMDYSLCKMVNLVPKWKMAKTCEKLFYKIIRVVLCKKNRSKKHQILEKWENFENWPSCKGYSPCKVYSPCKMVSLVQKFKMGKTIEKPFYKIIRVVLCKKALEKTPELKLEKWDNFENWPSCKDAFG